MNMVLKSTQFLLIVNRLLTVQININYTGHSRAMAFRKSLSI
jgi:hypothetical protein